MSAQGTGLKSISSNTERNSITAEFNCRIHYDDHSPRVQGNEIMVKLRTAPNCNLWDGEKPAEQTVPPLLRNMISRISLELVSTTASTLRIQFTQPMLFTARPGETPSSIEILTRVVATKPIDPILAADIAGQTSATPISAEPVDTQAMLADGRSYLLSAKYQAGIRVYRQLLAIPDSGQHPEALEYLSLAYQLSEAANGPSAQAQAGYESYLQRFPTNPDAARVQQRLDAMLASVDTSTEPATQPQTPALTNPMDSKWTVAGGITQDYWSATFDRDFAANSRTRSALVTLANLRLDRRGERYNLATRVDAGYQNELSDGDITEANQALVANAFVELRDKQQDWSTRLGRQSLFADGVLGRFDGARLSYGWKPNIRLNLTAGVPVDSPRFSGDTRRQFVAASVDLDHLMASRLDNLSTNLFFHRQSIDGISDREALGAEVNLRNGDWQASALVDYDLSYARLNTALLHVGHQLNQRLRVYARVRAFSAPYLTTRNALIGQSVATIDALQESYSQAQLRTLARDRTADGLAGATGFATAVGQRWNLNGDLGYLNTKGAVSSAGVIAQPDFKQIYSALTLVGSSLFRPGDSAIFGFRLDSSNVADTSSLLFDFRIPIGPSLRVGPKLKLSWRDASPGGDQQLLLEPGLRLLYRWRTRYRLEFDAGYRLTQQQFNEQLLDTPLYPEDRELSTELYFSLSWRVDF